MESLQIQISKMKCVLITPYRSGQFFVKAVEKLGDFTVEKKIQSNSNGTSYLDFGRYRKARNLVREFGQFLFWSMLFSVSFNLAGNRP